MSTKTIVWWGKFDGFSWIRCEGTGDFRVSPVIKKCTRAAEEKGENTFVIDLQQCDHMDSTFMGFLAGLAKSCKAHHGRVQIADASDKNRRSFEELGLDRMLEINPEAPVWQDPVAEIRSALKKFEGSGGDGIGARAKHILQAHQVLAGLDEGNAAEFSKVIEILERQVERDGG